MKRTTLIYTPNTNKLFMSIYSYMNSEQLGMAGADRKAIFDVYCQNDKGEKFIVEMQKAEQQCFKDRSVFYSTFPILDFIFDDDYSKEDFYCLSVDAQVPQTGKRISDHV